MGRAPHEVLEVALLEDGIVGAPQQQRGDLARAHPPGDALIRRVGGVARLGGDVRDEVRDALAALAGGVRGLVGLLDVLGRGGITQGQGGVQERGGPGREGFVHGAVERELQGRGDGFGIVVVHGGVGHDGRRVQLRVLLSPPLGDETAPVVGQRDHGQPGVVDTQRACEVPEVPDAVLESAEQPRALGEAHVQVVHGHHAPRLLGFLRGAQHVPPQVRPRGVAVHRQDDPSRAAARPGELGTVVQHVPAALPAWHGFHGRRGRDAHRGGPRGVQARQRGVGEGQTHRGGAFRGGCGAHDAPPFCEAVTGGYGRATRRSP